MFNLSRKNLEDENQKLKKELAMVRDIDYILGEESDLRGEKVNEMLRKLALNENAWKFMRKSFLDIMVSSYGVVDEREQIRRNAIIEGMMKWLEIGAGMVKKEESKSKVEALRKKYLPQRSK